jgi:hypothetical protein
MRGLFHPLEEYAGPSILAVGMLCFVFFVGSKLLQFSLEST